MDPREKSDLDAWDPMRRDWADENFNSYTSGPGRNLPKNLKDHKNVTTLVIKGVPAEMNQNGLRNIFSKYGDIQKIQLSNNNPGYSTQLGFVTLGSTAECMQAMNRENGRSFGSAKFKIELGRTRDRNNESDRAGMNSSQEHQTSNNYVYGRTLPSPFKNCTPKTLHQSAEFVKVNIDSASIEGPQQMYGLAITHFVTDDDHYMKFERFVMEYMEMHASRLASVGKPAVNQLVMAKYEDEWARGVIEQVLGERGDCMVRFIDYGNAMQMFYADLKKMPIELCKDAGFACRIKLEGVRLKEQADSKPVVKTLQALIGSEMCDCVIKSVTDYCLYVDLVKDGVSLVQTLLESSDTKPHVQTFVRPLLDIGDDVANIRLMKLTETDTFRVNYPSHVFSGSKAGIINKQLTDYAQLGPGEPFSVDLNSRGSHVMFPFENMWYRGEITKISLARMEFFVVALDQELSLKLKCEYIRCLPLKFAETPRQSYLECILHGATDHTQIVSILKPHVTKSLNMNVLKVDEKGIYTVRITTLDNEDVTEIEPVPSQVPASPTFTQPEQTISPPTNPTIEQSIRTPVKEANSSQISSGDSSLQQSQGALASTNISSLNSIPTKGTSPLKDTPQSGKNSADLQVEISVLRQQLAQVCERAARLEEENKKLELRNQELVRQNSALKKFSKF